MLDKNLDKKDKSERRRKIEQLRVRDGWLGHKTKKLLENTKKSKGINIRGKRLIDDN